MSGTPQLKVRDVKGVAPISRSTAYSLASGHFQTALDVVIHILQNSTNDNARLGAARTIIDKVLPDLKSSEITGEVALQLINVIRTPMKQPLEPVKDGEIVKESP